jgi:2-keto-4-pentenoate hydratase/2-oxohepta-3-ene-1,7-dioic acid hydratase in catechol pathway
MKLALYDEYVPAIVEGDRLYDISTAVGRAIMSLPGIYRMPAILEQFAEVREAVARIPRTGGIPVAGARLRAPIPRPSKMLFTVSNYFENIVTPPLELDFFLKAPSSVLDPGGTVVLPPHDAIIFHHEAELGVIIGRQAKNVSRADAMDYVFGYTCIIDVSSRGLGKGPPPGFRAKSFDTFCPLGPWIVSRDEISDPYKLGIKLWVDGQPRHDYNTDDMEHHIPELIEFASAISTLEVGDVIACGVNHQGVGPLQDGETAVIEIESIGRMSVSVSDPYKRRWAKQIDTGMGAAIRKKRLTGIVSPPSELYTMHRLA